MYEFKLIDEIGTCNPEFFVGTYEFDYCLRAKDAGFQIFMLPNGTIYDLKLGSAHGVPLWRTYYNTRNHLYLVINRRSLIGLLQWIKRETKYFFHILLYRDKKIKRLGLKFLASKHGVSGKLGIRISPTDPKYK